MAVLIKDDIMSTICSEIAECKESVMLVSAYCKLPLIRQFDMYINAADIEKVLLVRFRPEDIMNGSSDLELYPYCKAHGWKLFFRLDLHAKTYVFDRVRCVIGSANATGSGMSLGTQGNYEMATTCLLAEKDVRNLKLLLKGSIEMDDDIYRIMQQSIDRSRGSFAGGDIKWPEEITNMVKPDYSLLFSEDFPQCSSPIGATKDNLLFLNGLLSTDLSSIRESMENCKCYRWLRKILEDNQGNELYFGALTAQLHSQLLDEPKPYRKDVKTLLSNLLSWISILQCTDIVVDRPNHSQRIRLRK